MSGRNKPLGRPSDILKEHLIIINNNNNNNYNGNVIQKEFQNRLEYKNVSIEIQRMWNMKRFVIPVIIGATEIVIKG
jgi:hypothetical protein